MIPDITNPFYPLIARGLQNVLGPAGVQVLVTSTDADPSAEDAAVQQMITRRVDGLAFAGYQADHRRVAAAVEVGDSGGAARRADGAAGDRRGQLR